MKTQLHAIETVHRIASYINREGVDAPSGVEVGVDRGKFSEVLLRALPSLLLQMVDQWGPYPEGERYQRTGDVRAFWSAKKWDKVYREACDRVAFAGRRATQMRKCSRQAADQYGAGLLDFVFIDADHGYEGCLEDVGLWLPKVKPGAVFGGHDYDNPKAKGNGVRQAVTEAAASHGFGVELGLGYTWWAKWRE